MLSACFISVSPPFVSGRRAYITPAAASCDSGYLFKHIRGGGRTCNQEISSEKMKEEDKGEKDLCYILLALFVGQYGL